MPKRKIPSPKFTGELATPIKLTPRHELSPPSILDHPEGLEGVHKWWMELLAKEGGEIVIERTKKTLLLFKHYDIYPIHPDAGFNLAMKLAIDCVPGFQIVRPQKRGAKNKWDNSKLVALWWTVKSQKNKSARTICFNLAKKEPWKSLLKDKTEEARQKRLYAVYEEALNDPLVEFADRILNNTQLEETERRAYVQKLVGALEDCAAQPPRPLLFDEKMAK